MATYVRYMWVAAFIALVPQLAAASSILHETPARAARVAFAAQAGSATADEALTAKVKAQIDAEPTFSGSQVTVTAAGGVVTLRGVASDAVVRLKIVELTKATEGVTTVDNKITIAKAKK